MTRKENGWDKIHALSYLRTKYGIQKRESTGEAAIVTKIISEEVAKEIREYDDD